MLVFEKEFLITYNFDFIFDFKIYLNWLQSTRNQYCYTFDHIIKHSKIFDFIDFCGPSYDTSLSIKSKAVKFLTRLLLNNCDAFVFCVDAFVFFWYSAA